MDSTRRRIILVAAAIAMLGLGASAVWAASAAKISTDSRAALSKLYASNPSAKILGDKAKAVLVFPSILKAGFIVGGQGGDGAMIKAGKVGGYYRTLAASYGFQAGV